MKKIIAFFVAAMLAFCLCPLPTIFADAGFSYKTHVTDESIKNEISLVDWSYTRDITYAKYQAADGEYAAVKFGENGTARSYLNAVKRVENLGSLGYEDCINADFTLAIEEIPENVRFGFSFGLKNYLSVAGTANSSCLYFTKSGNSVCLNVSSFNQTGEETTVLSALPLANVKNENGLTVVSVDVSADGGIVVYVNTLKVYENADANLATEGYVGFSQTGGLEVYLVAVEIVSLAYDKPTTGVQEQGSHTSIADFSNNEFNVNEWFCSAIDGYYGGGMYIEDGMLVYDNASETVFSATHQYSNFSLEVELHDLQRVAEFDGLGNIVKPISTYIGFAFGRDLPDANVQSAHNVSEFLYIDPRVEDFTKPAYATSVRFRTGGREDEPVLLPNEWNFWNNDVAQDRTMFIRVSVIDGMISLELKYEDQTEYTQVYSKYLGYTPLGYVQIWSTGHGPNVTDVAAEQISSTSFKLDNIALTNKDDSPLTRVVSFETNKLTIPPDFPYVDTWNDADLVKSNWDGVSEIKGFLGLYSTIGFLGGVAIVVGAVLWIKRKTK